MQPLVDVPVEAWSGQQAFFFKKEKNGYTLNFVSQLVDDESKTLFNWHIMPLQSDFFEKLKVLGRLPKPSVQAFIKEIEEHEMLKVVNKRISEQLGDQALIKEIEEHEKLKVEFKKINSKVSSLE